MLRIVAVVVALCVPFAALIWRVDYRHSLVLDPRRASWRTIRNCKVICVAALVLVGMATAAGARPSPYPPVTQFVGDRYGSAQLGPEVVRGMGCPTPACVRKGNASKARHLYPTRKRQPAKRQRWRQVPIFAPLVERGAVGRLSGVVAPLAAKAREIVANCGSVVISGVRHTYIAGTGGRLSLHASGRAVDIKGNPACIRAHLAGWPGGASTDYAAVQHTHISYAPGGPEWGRRFAHHRGQHRHRHHRRRG